MKKKIFVASVASIAIALSTVTTFENAVAAEKNKLVKNKLVNKTSLKLVKGYAIFKKKLYKDGKITTKATLFNKKLYVNGKLSTKPTLFNKKLYVNGKLSTKPTLFNKKLYVNGKLSTKPTLFNKKLYVNGKLSTKPTLFNKKLYVNGKLSTKPTIFNKKLYVNGKLSTKPTLFNKKLYKKGGSLQNGTVIFKGKQYVNGIYKIDKVKPVINMPKNVKETYKLSYGQTFTIPLLTAKDKISGVVKVTSTIKNSKNKVLKKIDTKVADTYKISYIAKDAIGNQATKSITVIVAPKPDPSKVSYDKIAFNNEKVSIQQGNKLAVSVFGMKDSKKTTILIKDMVFTSTNAEISVNSKGEIEVSPFLSTGTIAKITASYTANKKKVTTVATVTVAKATASKPVEMVKFAKNYIVKSTDKEYSSIKIDKGSSFRVENKDGSESYVTVSLDNSGNFNEIPVPPNGIAIISNPINNMIKPENLDKKKKITITETKEQAFTVAKLNKGGSISITPTVDPLNFKDPILYYVVDNLNKAKVISEEYGRISRYSYNKVREAKIESIESNEYAVLSNDDPNEFFVYSPTRLANISTTSITKYQKIVLQPGESTTIKNDAPKHNSTYEYPVAVAFGDNLEEPKFKQIAYLNEQKSLIDGLLTLSELNPDSSRLLESISFKEYVISNEGENKFIIFGIDNKSTIEKNVEAINSLYTLKPGEIVKLTPTAAMNGSRTEVLVSQEENKPMLFNAVSLLAGLEYGYTLENKKYQYQPVLISKDGATYIQNLGTTALEIHGAKRLLNFDKATELPAAKEVGWSLD